MLKKWVTDHPYIFVSAVFLVIIGIGWHFLLWREDNFAFLLLLYLIVILGVRMDDISRKIGRGTDRSSQDLGEKETVISQLNDIKSSLLKLNAALNKLLKESEREGH
jgi:hypothetical protein